MHLRTYLATTRRILTQLRADRRTVGLIAIVPAALLTLLYFVYRDYPGADLIFNHIAVTMMAILPTTVMFLVTSVAMLRERVSGTLERLWTTPIHRADLLFGYATAFALTAVIQSLILCAVAAWGLDVDISASWGWVGWGQVVFAPLMMSLSFSVGVCPFKTMRGRRLRRSWMAWTWVSVTSVKLVPLGRYSRIRRLVFSLVGRCQGLWGSAK